MGMNMILTLIVGIVMTTMVGTQVAPSIIEQIKTKKVQTQTINNQEVIFEAIKRYTTMKQVAPTSITQLISANYIDAKVNDNGFGGTYTINVDKALGVATITTTISDPKAQEAFLNSFMGTSKPSYKVNEDGTWDTNKFETKYVLPNEVMHGNALLMTGIPIQDTPPNSDINKYWYDTSSGKATLKLYDGTNWIKLDLGGSVSIGSIETFAGVEAKIPEGYLLCNGQEVSRTTYKDLFDVIGTTYGSSSGTTFKVPDLRGEFIRGWDAMGGIARGVDSGRTFGSWQKGSFIPGDNDGMNNDMTFRSSNNFGFGWDKVTSIDLEGINYGDAIYSGGTFTTLLLSEFVNHSGISRPRNIAMNYIIKY